MPEGGWSWRRVTADALIHNGPVTFAGLIVAATGGGTADCTVYDGRDAGGKQFGTFRTPASRSEPHKSPKPARFDTGLFVAVGSNVEEVIVLYEARPG